MAPFKMKGSPMQRNFGIGSPAKLKGLATTLAKYGKKAYNAVKGVKKTTPKPKKSTYVSDLKKGTVTETTPKGTKIIRDSWPNVKPGTRSSFPGTSTDAMGKVGPFDPMKRQVLTGLNKSAKKK